MAGSSGSRVVAVSASSRWRRTSSPISPTASVVETHPGRDLAGQRLAGHAVLGQPALADVVQQRGDEQDVGPRDLADQRGRLHAGLDDVPVDGEPVDRRGVRQQPDPFPLGQHGVQRSGLLQRLPDRQEPPPGRQQPDQRLPGVGRPGVGQRRRLRHQPARGGRSQLDVALGGHGRRTQQQRRVGGRPRVLGEHHLATGQRHPGLDRHQLGTPYGAQPTQGATARRRPDARSAAAGG